MYTKRVKQYGALLSEVMFLRGRDDSFSLAIDLNDLPLDCERVPLFSFQKHRDAHNLLLPDVDFFHHAWYGTDRDPVPYEHKSITACFVGASTGRHLTVDDIKCRSSERLALAHDFQTSERVTFFIGSAVQCADAAVSELLRSQPYFSDPVDWHAQLQHRFLISVDGNGATCSRVVKSLRSNSVFVKFESPHELFYFSLLRPGEHFLSASSSNNVEVILDEEAAQPGRYCAIAAAGTAFAHRYLSAPAVVEYTALMLDRYTAVFPQR